jgi:hypothetical protein
VKGVGRGKSKKEAEQEAAKRALEELTLSNDNVQRSNESSTNKCQDEKDSFGF